MLDQLSGLQPHFEATLLGFQRGNEAFGDALVKPGVVASREVSHDSRKVDGFLHSIPEQTHMHK